MLVNIGKIKNTIAKRANITDIVLEALIPILIANVLTPWLLSPSMSSQPFIISRATKRENAVKKKNKMYGGIIGPFKYPP